MDTDSRGYADRLVTLESVWWKRLLPTQAPYRWNVHRQRLGRTLDVGCGIGRNLGTLSPGSVGVDHNAQSIQIARRRGYTAYTPEAFFDGEQPVTESFDGLLVAHVLEHLTTADARTLLRTYLPCLRPGGRVFLVCPQERGFGSDPTHVTFLTGEDLVEMVREAGLSVEASTSFPFPRKAGRVFPYNEFNVLATKPVRSTAPRG